MKNVIKRNGDIQEYNPIKIYNVIKKALKPVFEKYDCLDSLEDEANDVFLDVINTLEGNDTISIETIQNVVEFALMDHNKEAAKAFILYRDQRRKK